MPVALLTVMELGLPVTTVPEVLATGAVTAGTNTFTVPSYFTTPIDRGVTTAVVLYAVVEADLE